jgi:signal peptidase I
MLLVSLSAGLALVPLIGLTVAQPWHVEGRSMEPALADGSVLLVDSLGPRLTGYDRGDIVILPVPRWANYGAPLLVKRIVAVAGDHVTIQDGVVRVNGAVPSEPYLPAGTVTPVASNGLDLVVPPGDVFILGDHRGNSFDSKAFGPVPAATLLGRAWFAISPWGSMELPGAAAGAG